MDDIKACTRDTKSVDMGNWLMKCVKSLELAFVGDLILLAKSEEGLRHSLNLLKPSGNFTYQQV
jgi:hypothetical protein